MGLTRTFRTRTFALTMIIGGLLMILLGLVCGLLGGDGPVWATIFVVAGLVDVLVGALGLYRVSRRSTVGE